MEIEKEHPRHSSAEEREDAVRREKVTSELESFRAGREARTHLTDTALIKSRRRI